MNSVPLRFTLIFLCISKIPEGSWIKSTSLPLSVTRQHLQPCVHDVLQLFSICQWLATSMTVWTWCVPFFMCRPACSPGQLPLGELQALYVHHGGWTEKQSNGIFHWLAVGDIFMDGRCWLLLLLTHCGVMKTDDSGRRMGRGGPEEEERKMSKQRVRVNWREKKWVI